MSMMQRAMMEQYNFYSDARVLAAMRTTFWRVVKAGPSGAIVELDDVLAEAMAEAHEWAEGDNPGLNAIVWLRAQGLAAGINEEVDGIVIEVPTQYEVCDGCGGSGSMVDPRIDAGGLTREDFADDPDFARAYFDGHYDVRCSTCHGARVVAMPQFPEPLRDLIAEMEEEDAYYVAERASELRMGC